MKNTCPFGTTGISDSTCHKDESCALWVEDEKMCSFRLLADDVADHRRRIRAAGMETGEESFSKKNRSGYNPEVKTS